MTQTQRQDLSEWLVDTFDRCVLEAMTGVEDPESRKEREAEEHERVEYRLLESILLPCAGCGDRPTVETLDVGIDGGPSPVTMELIQVLCPCGMCCLSPAGYPSEKLQRLRRVVAIWNRNQRAG